MFVGRYGLSCELTAYPLGFFGEDYAHAFSQSGDCSGAATDPTAEHGHIAI